MALADENDYASSGVYLGGCEDMSLVHHAISILLYSSPLLPLLVVS